VTLILGNLSYPGKPARRSARDRRIVRLATVSSARSATPKIPATRGSRPPRLERARRGTSEPEVKAESCSRTSAQVRFLLRGWGTKLENPPRRVRVTIKQCGVACAEIAKKPNRKACCVDRPAEDFGSHLTAPLAALVRPREALMTPPSRTP
jgi:hypothetical protein